MGCHHSRASAIKDENLALKARVSLVQDSMHEYEERLKRAAQDEHYYQDQLENARLAMQAAVSDVSQRLKDAESRIGLERRQFAQRERELESRYQKQIANMHEESERKENSLNASLVEVTERLDARVHFEQSSRVRNEAELSSQTSIIASLQTQLNQSVEVLQSIQEENKRLKRQIEYYSGKLRKIHSAAVRKSLDLDDEETFGWDDVVEEVENAVPEALGLPDEKIQPQSGTSGVEESQQSAIECNPSSVALTDTALTKERVTNDEVFKLGKSSKSAQGDVAESINNSLTIPETSKTNCLPPLRLDGEDMRLSESLEVVLTQANHAAKTDIDEVQCGVLSNPPLSDDQSVQEDLPSRHTRSLQLVSTRLEARPSDTESVSISGLDEDDEADLEC